MGVKVKLADNREVGNKKHSAGDVVDVSPGDARRLVALGAAAAVNDAPKPRRTAGTSQPADIAGTSTTSGAARQKG